MLLLEVSDKFAQRHFSGDLETIPQSPFNVVVLLLLSGRRLRQRAQRQSKINETVLVAIKCFKSEEKSIVNEGFQPSSALLTLEPT